MAVKEERKKAFNFVSFITVLVLPNIKMNPPQVYIVSFFCLKNVFTAYT